MCRFILLAALLLVICRAQQLQSPLTRRALPASTVRRRAGLPDAPPARLASFVYEVDEAGTLTGDGLHVNLLSATRLLPAAPEGTYSLNGNAAVRALPTAHVRQGAGWTVVWDDRGDVVNVWNDRLFLEPLDTVQYPGVFVDTSARRGSRFAGQLERPALRKTSLGETELELLPNLTSRQSGGCRRIEVAVAFDNQFCALFGSAEERAVAYVQATFNYANFVYERDMCHSIVLVHVEAHCGDPNDPYRRLSQFGGMPASQRSTYILNGFVEFWNANRASVHRDLAYFFSGFEEDTGTIGVASVGAACTSFGYGWVELGDGPVLVHELGHNLGAPHDASGIMAARLDRAAPVVF